MEKHKSSMPLPSVLSKEVSCLFTLAWGIGTGETGEARASPEIRGCLKSNSQIGKKRNCRVFFFFSASPEIILFLGPCLSQNGIALQLIYK